MGPNPAHADGARDDRREHAAGHRDRDRLAGPGLPGAAGSLLDRCRWYVEHGSRLALLVDPRRRTIDVVRAGAEPATLRGNDVLDLGEVVPGLTLVVSDLFSALSFD